MTKYLFYFCVFVFTFSSYSANPPGIDSLKLWSHSATTALNFSQVSFSNWSAGGESSISATGLLKCALAYKDSTKIWIIR